MATRLNNSENYEHLCNVMLTKDKFPIAFEEKVCEMMENGMSREDAEKYVGSTPIELEIYYEKGYGLFAVETEAVDVGTIYSPYSKTLYDNYTE